MQNDSLLKRDVTVSLALQLCVCLLFRVGREGGRQCPEPAEGSWFFSELAQWGWEVFQAGCCRELKTIVGLSSGRGQASDPERGCDQVTCCITSPAGSRGWRSGW